MSCESVHGQTDQQTHGTDNIKSSTNAGGKNVAGTHAGTLSIRYTGIKDIWYGRDSVVI